MGTEQIPPGLFCNEDRLASEGVIRIGNVPQSYASFAAAYGLAGPFTGDDSHDGLPNGMEYALGHDPAIPGSRAPGLPVLTGTGNTDTFRFSMPDPIGADVRLLVQSSIDLNSWNTISIRSADGQWSGAGQVAVVPAAQGREEVTLTAQENSGNRYYRLSVRLLP